MKANAGCEARRFDFPPALGTAAYSQPALVQVTCDLFWVQMTLQLATVYYTGPHLAGAEGFAHWQGNNGI